MDINPKYLRKKKLFYFIKIFHLYKFYLENFLMLILKNLNGLKGDMKCVEGKVISACSFAGIFGINFRFVCKRLKVFDINYFFYFFDFD